MVKRVQHRRIPWAQQVAPAAQETDGSGRGGGGGGPAAGQALLEEAGDLPLRASFSASLGSLGQARLTLSAGQERGGTARTGCSELSCQMQAFTERCWGRPGGQGMRWGVAGRHG